ncbi:MAG: hypothetical protein ACYCTE_16625 [Acidimicrobiales bacterium]
MAGVDMATFVWNFSVGFFLALGIGSMLLQLEATREHRRIHEDLTVRIRSMGWPPAVEDVLVQPVSAPHDPTLAEPDEAP